MNPWAIGDAVGTLALTDHLGAHPVVSRMSSDSGP